MKRLLLAIALALFCLTRFTFAQTNWSKATPVGRPQIPIEAVIAGQEYNGTPLYTCRGRFPQYPTYGLQPGKYRSDWGGCDVSYQNSNYVVQDFDFLVTKWTVAYGGDIPSGAVQNGYDIGGQPLYYCRAYLPGSVQPGKIRTEFGGCAVTYSGRSEYVSDYEVLTYPAGIPAMPFSISAAGNGTIPLGAIRGGTDANGEALYVCLANYGGGLHPGKIRKEFGACYIPYGWAEVAVSSYYILVPNWMTDPQPQGGIPRYDFPAGQESNGTPLYACIAKYRGGTQPGKFRKDFAGCNFGYGAGNLTVTTFGLLTSWDIIR